MVLSLQLDNREERARSSESLSERCAEPARRPLDGLNLQRRTCGVQKARSNATCGDTGRRDPLGSCADVTAAEKAGWARRALHRHPAVKGSFNLICERPLSFLRAAQNAWFKDRMNAVRGQHKMWAPAEHADR